VSARPPELDALRARMAELSDLGSLSRLLFWDQQTMMPPGGAEARAERAATLSLTIHARESDPGLGALLDALEPWAAGEDPDSDDVRLVYWSRRDYEKSVRVPPELAAEMSKARALGQHAWQEARAANDYGRFRDSLQRHVELRQRYVRRCSPSWATPSCRSSPPPATRIRRATTAPCSARSASTPSGSRS
jgi:carboxypeptidase Taq